MRRDDSEPVFPHWGKIVHSVARTLGRTVHDEETIERGRRRMAKGAQVGEIAVRAWTEPDGWKPAKRRARNAVPAPTKALAVVTVPAPGSDALWFLLWAFVDLLDPTRPALGVAWREGIPARDVAGIQASAESQGLLRARVGPLKEFLKRAYRWLYRRGYRIPLVGWVLPRDLGRMASDWTRAEDDGYSLVLWTQPDKQRRGAKRRRRRVGVGMIENPNRPRVTLVGIGGGRALMRFAARLRADRNDRIPDGSIMPKKGWSYPGRFVDLAAFTSGPDGIESDSLEEAARSYGVPVEEPVLSGDPLTDELQTAAARLRTICRLYAATVAEHDRHVGIDLQPHQVLGPPSYARAYLEAAGLVPLLRRFADLPRVVLAKSFAAYHGGEHRIGFRVPFGVAVPVVPLDFSGQFPVVAVLGGVWEIFTAKTLEVAERTPEELVRFVADLAVRVRAWIEGEGAGAPITAEEWRVLIRTFVDVLPAGAVLPRKLRRPLGKTWQMRVGPLASLEPIPFCLSDVLRATLETADLTVPEIVSGFTLVPHGRVRMRSVTLPDETKVGPAEDLILALLRMRKAVVKRMDLEPSVRERLAAWSKAVVNAIVAGLPAQMDPKSPVEGTRKVHIFGPEGSHRILRRRVVEQPGAWCFPPIAAGVTAGGRLLLFLARSLVRQLGGMTLYEAVDSLAVVASENRGFFAVEGGPLTDGDVAGFRMLSVDDVRSVMERIEVFSPYLASDGGPQLLKVDAEAQGHEAFMHAVSPLRSYLYTIGEAGGRPVLEVRKASEQSLGQLLSPPGAGSDWIDRAAEHVLRLGLGIQSEESPGWDEPALAVVAVAVPGESRYPNGRDRRPWSLLVVARPHPVHGPKLTDGSSALPAALWREDFDPDRAEWFDLSTGEAIPGRVRAARTGEGEAYGPKRWVLSYRTVIGSHFSRVPDHVLGPDGEPAGSETFGLLRPAPMEAWRVRLIGREMNMLDRVGVTIDPVYADYTDEAGARRLVLLVLREFGPMLVAKETGFPVRSVRWFLSKARTSADRWLGYSRAADRLASDALMRWDTSLDLPRDTGARCYLYLRESGRVQRNCLRCGTQLIGRQEKWCSARCKQRGQGLRANGHIR
jgi:hypothetical protein